MKTYYIRTGGATKEFYLRLGYLLVWYTCVIWFVFRHVDWIRYNPCLYLGAGYIIWYIIRYADHFFMTQITKVNLCNDGVEANWVDRFPFKILRKKIKWDDINIYKTSSPMLGGWYSLTIKSKAGKKYLLVRKDSPLFIKEDEYNTFLEDFKSRYSKYKNGPQEAHLGI